MRKFTRFLVALALAGWMGAAQALVMTYDNLADWTTATGGASVVSDPFDNDIEQSGVITFDSGVKSAVLAVFFTDNSVANGRFRMAVGGDIFIASPTNDWWFPSPIFAFGFDFFDANAGAGTSVLVDDGSGPVSFELFTVGNGSSGFAGFISDSGTFSNIRFYSQLDLTDAYRLDNLVFAAPVPAPDNLALLSLGLAVLGWSKRRKA